MSNLFNPDNKFFTFMGKVADLMILNFLCIICCIPIITIGPAITAMYYTTMKMVKNEETYIVRGFFHSFRQNLKQGIIIHLIMLVLGLVLIFDLYFSRNMQGEGSFYKVLAYIFMVGLTVFAMVFTYIYPVLAKFYNTIKHTFKNALLMSIRHLPYTLLMLAITIVPWIIGIFVNGALSMVVLFYFLMGFSVVCYLHSIFFVKIFDKYIPQEEEGEENEEKEIDSSVFTNLQPTNEINENSEEKKAPWKVDFSEETEESSMEVTEESPED